MKNQIFKTSLLALSLVLISACSTKRQYFSPEIVDKSLSSNANLKAKIIDTNSISATLKNQNAIIKDMQSEIKIEKNFNIIGYENDEIIIADNAGNLKILDMQSNEIYADKFDSAVISASVSGDDIALILANNTIALSNRSLGMKFAHNLTAISAVDSRISAPVFVENLIVYPTLDGKVVTLLRDNGQIVRNVIVSVDDFFNNVFFLKIYQDKLIAATARKIVVLSPNQSFALSTDIKEVVFNDDSLFIFEKNGNIIKTDLSLNKLAEKKLDFAIFTKATIFNNALYVAEKTGYLIKLDLNLKESLVYEASDLSDELIFISNNKFFYNNKILSLK